MMMNMTGERKEKVGSRKEEVLNVVMTQSVMRMLCACKQGFRCPHDILQSLLSVMQTSERKMGDSRAEEETRNVLHESRDVLTRMCWLRDQ